METNNQIQIQADIIKAALLSGMRPVVGTRSNGSAFMQLTNGRQKVFVAPYRDMGPEEIVVNIKNLAESFGASLEDFVKDEDISVHSLDALHKDVENLEGTMIDKLYYQAEVKGYDSAEKMDSDDARMKKEASAFPVGTKQTEAGVRYYIAQKNLDEFGKISRQVGIHPGVVNEVYAMKAPKGEFEVISDALQEKVAKASFDKATKKSDGDPAL